MPFEEQLRRALAQEDEEIESPAELWEKIKTQIFLKKEGGAIFTIKGNPINSFFLGQPVWKKAMAGILGGAFLLGGLTYSFSPQACAWAKEEVISPVKAVIYKVIRVEDGYSVVKLNPQKTSEKEGLVKSKKESPEAKKEEKEAEKLLKVAKSPAEVKKILQEKEIAKYGPVKAPTDPSRIDPALKKESPKDINKISKGKITPQYVTESEAQEKIGFPVHLPTYLPKEYKRENISGDRWEKTGKAFANVLYRLPEDNFSTLCLMITDDKVSFLQGGDAVKEVRVNDKIAYLSEFPIVINTGKYTEPIVKVGHMLKWKENGLVYVLKDNGQLSLEEMLKVAESIK